MNPKQRAADAAVSYVSDGMIVGLGSGTTSFFFHSALAERIKLGQLRNIIGVPTSRATQLHAAELGIPLSTLKQHPRLDVTIDGADEIDPSLNLIKGLGGAALREKIVAQSSTRFIIIADSSKLVAKLGTKSPVPVEVVPFAHETHVPFFESLGARPALRMADAQPYITDNGNLIYDCHFNGIDDPKTLQAAFRSRAGVVGTGLFLGMAHIAIVADESTVRTLQR